MHHCHGCDRIWLESHAGVWQALIWVVTVIWQMLVYRILPRDASIYSQSILQDALSWQTHHWHGCDRLRESCQGLTRIDMSHNNNMTDVGISYLAQGCIHVQSINTGSCSQLTDASLSAIGESCRGLTSIDMSCNSNMTDVGISYLAQGCIHLQSINIRLCCQLTDASLAAKG